MGNSCCNSHSGSSYQDNADVDVSGASLARTAQLRHNPVSACFTETSMPHNCYSVLLCHDARSTMKISHCQETHDNTWCYSTFDFINKKICVGKWGSVSTMLWFLCSAFLCCIFFLIFFLYQSILVDFLLSYLAIVLFWMWEVYIKELLDKKDRKKKIETT